MHPILFEFNTPEWLQGIFPAIIRMNTYGTMIAIGAILGYTYLARRLKRKYGVSPESSQNLFIILLVAGFVGGKLFFYFEDFSPYLANPKLMIEKIGGGFVFYGSLLFCLPVVIWFAKRHKVPLLQMLDGIAITACIAHIFGRMGCLGAGCCHGVVAEGLPWAITYSDPMCAASPLDTPLHPTPIYSILLIGSILLLLLWAEKKQGFDGQLFLTYAFLYTIGRSIIEEFRGDEARGFVFDGLLSHSQLISLIFLIAVVAGYVYLYKNKKAEVK